MTLSNAVRLVSQSAASLFLGGCTLAPSIPVFGAAFPDWLFCIVGGVGATVIVHLALGLRNVRSSLAPVAVSYLALCAMIALAAWLIFFL